MNKADLAEGLAEQMGGSKAEGERAIEYLISTITETLQRGEEVSIAGMGIFSVRDRAARDARNPRTGDVVHVPATRVPKFRAAKALKDAVKT